MHKILIPLLLMTPLAAAPRADFGDFDRRANAGETLNVIFLGGSLTWGAQATDPQLTSYRALTSRRLEERYPSARFRFHDAAIGGTGSQLAAYRLERDVLARKPDLVFLDFTVNDFAHNPPDADKLASYESLVRRMVERGVAVVQVILPLMRDVGDKRPPRPLDNLHIAIGEAYGLPRADAVTFVRRRVAEGATTPELLWDVPGDRTHPGDAGYALYAEAVWDAFEKAVREGTQCRLPEHMLNADTYMTINRALISRFPSLPAGWTTGQPHRSAVAFDFTCSRWMDTLGIAATGAQPLRMKIRANSVLLFGEGTPISGRYEVRIDGGEPKTYDSGANAKAGNLRYVQFIAQGLATDREHWVEITPLLAAGQELRIESVCVAGSPAQVEAAADEPPRPIRHLARVTADAVTLPERLRAPLGWPLLELAPGRAVTLRWPGLTAEAPRGGWLRITTGIDDRDFKRVSARLARTGDVLGVFEVKKAHALEPFQLRVDAAAWSRIADEGVTLTLEEPSKRPLWLLADNTPVAAHAPQLLADEDGVDRLARFYDNLGSLASLQPFGWMNGCVLDGVQDMAQQGGDARWVVARDAHLGAYFRADGTLIYEDPSSVPADGHIRSVEETLPFAVLAKTNPTDARLELALDYWKSITREDGSVEAEDRLVSAEGSYTIAYPMAVIARVRGDKALAERAALQLRIRSEWLHRPDGIWLRYWRSKQEHHFRSWARGVAWYLVGLERSLEELRGTVDTADLEADFKRAASWAISMQREDGLWGCFLDAPDVRADTSGSAGIAAALVRGAKAGLLPAEATSAARRTWAGLQMHLTVDGFLDGAAQSNRGGEALQRSDYRVLSPMGMGLMGQLAAALHAQ
jgi:unsaturated rhamnogalacturonyl hydrolase